MDRELGRTRHDLPMGCIKNFGLHLYAKTLGDFKKEFVTIFCIIKEYSTRWRIYQRSKRGFGKKLNVPGIVYES